MMSSRYLQLGRTQVDISKAVRDIRGVEDMVEEVIRDDWQELRAVYYGVKLAPFADAADIAEWDNLLLNRCPPLFPETDEVCTDCFQGPCELSKGKGRCGLAPEAFQSKLSLRMAVNGCLTQMSGTRELLDYALKEFGRDKPVSMGRLVIMSDSAPSINVLTGIYPRNLGDLEKAMAYADAQILKLLGASYRGVASVQDFGSMTFHAGSVLFLAMDVAELIKISCFEFNSSADQELVELRDYQPANIQSGLGSLEQEKAVLAFAGDNFLPAWVACTRMKEQNLDDQIALCGLGSVGQDIARFYDKCHPVGTSIEAGKMLRTGMIDVLVASQSCVPLDLVNEAKMAGTILIWVDQGYDELPDRTDTTADEIVDELAGTTNSVRIRDVEKAGEVAVRLVQAVKAGRKRKVARQELSAMTQSCKKDCDLCSFSCSLNLPIGQAVRRTAGEGLGAWGDVAKDCYFCGKCELSCPQGIPLLDMIAEAVAGNTPKDRYIMRAGRGPISAHEYGLAAFPLVWGNSPGYAILLGCGDAKKDDLGWIAHELVTRNFFVWASGCGSTEIARYFDEVEKKFIFQEFGAECGARNILNCGGCSATAHLMDVTFKVARGGGISLYGNYAESADYDFFRLPKFIIIWGGIPERMYAMAAGLARNGNPVIVGPASGFRWKRCLMGDKYNSAMWWMYDGVTGAKKQVEPSPRNLIVPVETKEEAVLMGASLLPRPLDLRDSRHTILETYIELSEELFGDLPDDWPLFLRTDMELPVKQKARLLKQLRDKYGWEIERLRVIRARHPDGRLLSLQDYTRNYGIPLGDYATGLPRLIMKRKK